ncbi:hypothetical protein IMG5_037250 [Ichthyophthirius multifiliis]|uniref:Transmembrane protein n=1 Tax=Ichthyophthirius multifiliis TaxID=5932 RepID=G0QLV5_ICHMU|nr:hypothetical protein IMG5_037250 [Ichthyophthirius multifiliis]EGR33801.1 hypothetical protein IMG5_037250 [Ichthyophthirius multifiliis]|eukprot:XP_004039025.1 hypothetical protein IMG5_037250 [Ichthyophthirius multifiliis]
MNIFFFLTFKLFFFKQIQYFFFYLNLVFFYQPQFTTFLRFIYQQSIFFEYSYLIFVKQKSFCYAFIQRTLFQNEMPRYFLYTYIFYLQYYKNQLNYHFVKIFRNFFIIIIIQYQYCQIQYYQNFLQKCFIYIFPFKINFFYLFFKNLVCIFRIFYIICKQFSISLPTFIFSLTQILKEFDIRIKFKERTSSFSFLFNLFQQKSNKNKFLKIKANTNNQY